MSLREAVFLIADAMDKEVTELEKKGEQFWAARLLLGGYVNQLRIALKASEEEYARITPKDVGRLPPDLFGLPDPKETTEFQAARARREASSDRPDAPFETATIATAPPGADVVGDQLPVAGMPVGAYVPVAGSVFRLHEDGRLYYSEQKTKEWREAQAQRK